MGEKGASIDLVTQIDTIKEALKKHDYACVLELLAGVPDTSSIPRYHSKIKCSVLHLIAAHLPKWENEEEKLQYQNMVNETLRKAQKIDVRETANTAQTPLLNAAERGNSWLCERLVSAGANINLQDRDGLGGLHCACFSGSLETVEFFVKRLTQEKINEKSYGSWDLLEWLEQVPEVERSEWDDDDEGTVRYARRRYADDYEDWEPQYVEEEDADRKSLFENEGLTPLHCALMSGELEIMEYLLENGASVAYYDADGLNFLTYDVRYGCPINAKTFLRTLELFQKYGGDINTPDATGSTPLCTAVLKGNLEAVLWLLEAGALPESRLYRPECFKLPKDDANLKMFNELKKKSKQMNGPNPLIHELFEALELKQSLAVELPEGLKMEGSVRAKSL